jgi:hypothetical protein
LWLLFCPNFNATSYLIGFYFTKLPEIETQCMAGRNLPRLHLCSLFRFLVKMILQGPSIYPRELVEVGKEVMFALKGSVAGNEPLLLLANLLVDRKTWKPRSGWNAAEATDADLLLEHEYEKRVGTFGGFVKAMDKYDEYKERLMLNRQFRADWRSIKRQFHVQRYCDDKGAVRRSLPARSMREVQDKMNFEAEGATNLFDVAFSFFCWKWFLEGMQGDEPLVEKLRYEITPYGTQIFIPGYWSFDSTRDVEWPKMKQDHLLRGVKRQGKDLADDRRMRKPKLELILRLKKNAKKRGLKGNAFYEDIITQMGYHRDTDRKYIDRKVKEAEKLFGE